MQHGNRRVVSACAWQQGHHSPPTHACNTDDAPKMCQHGSGCPRTDICLAALAPHRCLPLPPAAASRPLPLSCLPADEAPVIRPAVLSQDSRKTLKAALDEAQPFPHTAIHDICDPQLLRQVPLPPLPLCSAAGGRVL